MVEMSEYPPCVVCGRSRRDHCLATEPPVTWHRKNVANGTSSCALIHDHNYQDTVTDADRNARFVEKVREAYQRATYDRMSGFSHAIEQSHLEIYNAPCKPAEPVKE